RQLAFDARAHEACIERIIATFTPAYFERVRGWGSDSEVPVFIVGMPRSGSTLVEQILASHPQVLGGGEIGPMHALTNRHGAAGMDFCFTLRGKRAAEDLAGEYLETIDPAHCGRARATVKTLDNFMHLGLIATLFPRARIIHCRRDPLDVCLSCYFQNFQNVDFAWSLEDIGAYYRSYDKLMGHWSRVLPVPMHEVQYEELTR